MTYTTPELLLVGAAQSLVLGTSPEYDGKTFYRCTDEIEADTTFVDENAW